MQATGEGFIARRDGDAEWFVNRGANHADSTVGSEAAVGRMRRLDPQRVVAHLGANGLISMGQVVRDGTRVRDLSRRNRNFLVSVGGAAFFVKQGRAEETRKSLANEAHTLRWLEESDKGGDAGWGGLPRLLHFDDKDGIAVLSVEGLGQTLGEYLHGRRRGVLALGSLGDMLGKLHRTMDVRASDRARSALRSRPFPFVLAELPAEVHALCSGAALDFLRMVQSSQNLVRSLAALEKDWRLVCLIHGDVRWDNVLVAGARASSRVTRALLVDWELTGLGDPAWDVGCAFAEVLRAWLQSASTCARPHEVVHFASRPLPSFGPATRRFWRRYVEARGLSDTEQEVCLHHAMRCAGARVVALAFEQQRLAERVLGRAVYMAQLGENLLARPLEGADVLLGLGGAA